MFFSGTSYCKKEHIVNHVTHGGSLFGWIEAKNNSFVFRWVGCVWGGGGGRLPHRYTGTQNK